MMRIRRINADLNYLIRSNPLNPRHSCSILVDSKLIIIEPLTIFVNYFLRLHWWEKETNTK